MARRIGPMGGGGVEENMDEEEMGDERTRELRRDAESDPMQRQTEVVEDSPSVSRRTRRDIRERDNRGARGDTNMANAENKISERDNQGSRGTKPGNRTDYAEPDTTGAPETETPTPGIDGGAVKGPVDDAPVGAPDVSTPEAGPDTGGPAGAPGSDDFGPTVTRKPPSGTGGGGSGGGSGGGGSNPPTTPTDDGGGFGNQGIENTSGPNADQAKDVEQDVLDQYSFLDAGDVAIVTEEREGEMFLVPELSESARREIARRDIASQLDAKYPTIDIGPGDVTVKEQDGGGYTGFLDEEAQDELVTTALSGPGTENKAEAVADIQAAESSSEFSATTDVPENAREAVADIQIQENAGSFYDRAPAQYAADRNPNSQAAKAVDELATRVSNLDFAEFKQTDQKGKIGGGGLVVGGPAVGQQLGVGRVTRQQKTGKVDPTGDFNWERVIDPLGLLFPGPGDKVEQSFETTQNALGYVANEVGLFGAGIARISIDDGPDVGEGESELNLETLREAYDREGIGGSVDYIQDIGQQKVDQPGPRGEMARDLTRLPIDLTTGGLSLVRMGMEAVESGAYIGQNTLEGKGGEAATEVGTNIALATSAALGYAIENKYSVGATSVASLGVSSKIFKAADRAGPRTSATARYLIQPGEELLGKAGYKAVKATRGDASAQRWFPNEEPLVFSEEAAIRGTRRVRSGLERRIGRTRRFLAGEESLPPGAYQQELVNRFRPGSATNTLEYEAEYGAGQSDAEMATLGTEVTVEPVPGESSTVGATSEPLGSGGTGSLLENADTTEMRLIGPASPSSSPTPETSASAGGGPRSLPLFEEIETAGGVRPYLRGEDLPPRIPKTALGKFAADERATASGALRGGMASEYEQRSEFTDYSIYEDTLAARKQLMGDYEGDRTNPLGSSRDPLWRSQRYESEIEGETLRERAERPRTIEVALGVTATDTALGVGRDTRSSPASRTGVEPVLDLDVMPMSEVGLDVETESATATDFGLDTRSATDVETRWLLEQEQEQEREWELEWESETETELETELVGGEGSSDSSPLQFAGRSWTLSFEGIDPLTGEYR